MDIREYGDAAAAQLESDFAQMSADHIQRHCVELARSLAMVGRLHASTARALEKAECACDEMIQFAAAVLVALDQAEISRRKGRKREAWQLVKVTADSIRQAALTIEPATVQAFDMASSWDAFFHPLKDSEV